MPLTAKKNFYRSKVIDSYNRGEMSRNEMQNALDYFRDNLK